MRRSTPRGGDDPFRPEPAGRKGLRLTAATSLLAGAACCVYFMPAANAVGSLPFSLAQVAGAVGALGCLGGAALLLSYEW